MKILETNLLRVSLATTLTAFVFANGQAAASELSHVRLKDRLDRPADGYCLDIVGTASNMMLDLPLFTHNCKSGPTADSSVAYTDSGQLLFPGAQVCITAFGVNNTVLPGTSVLLRRCDSRTGFFNTANLQKFDHLKNGQLQLRGYDLCLAVGEQSSHTFSASDRWRVLSLQSCAGIELPYSSWEMVPF